MEAQQGRAANGDTVVQLPKTVDVCMLLRLRDRIKRQVQDCSVAIQADQTPCFDHGVDEESLKNATEDLEIFTEELKLVFQNKSLALQRMQLGFHLKNKVKQHDNESRLIIGSMEHITMLSRRVIEYQQQARETETMLIAIKRRRLALKNTGEQKILRILTMKKEIKEKQAHVKESKMLEKLSRSIQKERERITVLQNVFQSILIGSRVNWVEDPSLKAIVLQLEKNVFSM